MSDRHKAIEAARLEAEAALSQKLEELGEAVDPSLVALAFELLEHTQQRIDELRPKLPENAPSVALTNIVLTAAVGAALPLVLGEFLNRLADLPEDKEEALAASFASFCNETIHVVVSLPLTVIVPMLNTYLDHVDPANEMPRFSAFPGGLARKSPDKKDTH
jgi:hypothetical protein